MNQNDITLAIDVMGGDDAPYKILKGTEIFLKKINDVNIVFFGDKKIIEKSIKENKFKLINYKIINTQDNILNEDSPNIIIRNRKDSSISKGLEYIKNINNSGFISAGNTAAIMILSKLKLGMLQGIDRPAICSIIPNKINYSIMLDLGADITPDAKSLFQFSLMGNLFSAKRLLRTVLWLETILATSS